MRIRLHPASLDGKPLPGDGPVLVGQTPTELVALMRLQTPFSAELPVAAYREDVLRRVEGEAFRLLPADAAAADAEFLTRLAQRAHLEFLPDDGVPDEPAPTQTTEDAPCADK